MTLNGKYAVGLAGLVVVFVALCAGLYFADYLIVGARLRATPGIDDFRQFATEDVVLEHLGAELKLHDGGGTLVLCELTPASFGEATTREFYLCGVGETRVSGCTVHVERSTGYLIRLAGTLELPDAGPAWNVFSEDIRTVADAVNHAAEIEARVQALPQCPQFIERCVGADAGFVRCPSQLGGSVVEGLVEVVRRCRTGAEVGTKFAPCDDDEWRSGDGRVAE